MLLQVPFLAIPFMFPEAKVGTELHQKAAEVPGRPHLANIMPLSPTSIAFCVSWRLRALQVWAVGMLMPAPLAMFTGAKRKGFAFALPFM